jgi:hypothetical protein
MGKNKTPTAAAMARQEDNVLDTKFHLRFVERLYDGSPRWWHKGWSYFAEKVAGDKYDTLEREPGVKSLMYYAHDRKQYYNIKIPYLETCVNPVCPLRSWITVSGYGSGHLSYVRNEQDMKTGVPTVAMREAALAAAEVGLENMAKGKWDALKDTCPQCSHKMPFFPVSLINDKWVYVLKESGQSLTPYLAVHLESPDSGFVYTSFKNGEFQSQGHAFDGKLIIDKIETQTWHFFLSPMKLGKQALALLSKVPSEDPKYAKRRSAIDHTKWDVAVFPDLQPWSATVKRKFQPRQLKTPWEYVALVDAFAWVAEIADFDYLPILGAQQKLIQDPEEQAKSFIASTLAQVIGKQQVQDNPPKWTEDQWDVTGETVEVPSGATGGANIAEAWVKRYQQTLSYLTQETNYACTRVWFPMRFSLAHRIVELACQENQDDAAFMTRGLVHWAHVLREMLACQAGEPFIVWLASNSEAADRIPQKNVLGGDGLALTSKLGRAVGVSLPVHVLMHLSPVIVAQNDSPGKVLQKHLEAIGVSATTFGIKDALAIRDLAISIAPVAIDAYLKSLPEGLDGSTLRKLTIATSMKDRVETFTQLKSVEEGLTLLMEVAEYGKKEERTDSEWERNAYKDQPGIAAKVKEKIETPAKVAKFLGEQAHKLMKATVLSGEAQTEIVEKLEKEGLRKGFANLTREQAELYAAGRSLACFRWVGIGLKVLAGPVGLVIGGCELVLQAGQMMDSFRAGDPGAAVSHGLQAAAAALIIVVAGAECVALFTGAATAAWAGPVGWIAAALLIIGGLVMMFCAKNDLQLYARHCFLGVDYGNGEYDLTGKVWMGHWGWAELRYERGFVDAADRFQRQRLALLRMISGFSTWIGPPTYAGGFIFPSFVPAGAYFDIEVDVMPVGEKEPKQTFGLVVWPDRKEHYWRGSSPGYGSKVSFDVVGSRVTGITVVAPPTKFDARKLDYNLRVRLMFDEKGKNGLPVTTKWLKNSTIGRYIYSQVSTSDADVATKEKGEEEVEEGAGKETVNRE